MQAGNSKTIHCDVAAPMDIIWGAAEIARAIDVPTRRAFYLLERGLLPATKIGDSWCASRAALQKRLLSQEGE